MPTFGHYDDDSDDDFHGAYDDQDGYGDLGCYDVCVDQGVDYSYRYDDDDDDDDDDDVDVDADDDADDEGDVDVAVDDVVDDGCFVV